MKKLLLVIPLALIFIHFAYELMGPNMWTQSLTGAGPIWSVAVNPTNAQIMYAASNTQGIWKTTNSGLNWATSNSGISNLSLSFVVVSASTPNTIYAGGTGGTIANGMYKSTDAGATWTVINNGITQSPNSVQQISVSPTNANDVLICIWDGGAANATDGVYRSTNGGSNWVAANTGMGSNKNILCLARNPLNPNTVYCGTSFLVPNPPGTGPPFVYKSYDGGSTWTNMSSGLPSTAADINPIRYIDISRMDTSIAILGMFYNVVTPNAGVYYTSNGGTSWIQRSTGLPSAQGTLPRSVLIRPASTTEFYASIVATGLGGVYRTTNAGLLWTNFTTAPLTPGSTIRQMVFRTAANFDSTLFAANAGTAGVDQGVFEYTFVPLGIGDPGEIPKDFSLSQNYPNPFNPNTVIEFAIPKSAFVKMKVYDVSGREIRVLVNEQKSPGNYNITFNAEGLASGIYIYSIEAGDFKDVKKMSLVK